MFIYFEQNIDFVYFLNANATDKNNKKYHFQNITFKIEFKRL